MSNYSDFTTITDYVSYQKSVDLVLSERNSKKNMVFPSMFEDADNDTNYNFDTWKIKAPNLSSVFFEGKVKFIQRYRGFETQIVENPTWADVVYYANESILWGMNKEGLDGWHHVFLEEVEFVKEEQDVKVFEFLFGS